MFKFLLIAIGGVFGALLRYWLSGLVHRYFDGSFPWGTLSVNLVGAGIIGFLWGIFEETTIPANLRFLFFVGFLGSFTTFSTYALETFNLIRDGEVKLALLNVLLSNILGIVMVIAGFLFSKYLILFVGRR